MQGGKDVSRGEQPGGLPWASMTMEYASAHEGGRAQEWVVQVPLLAPVCVGLLGVCPDEDEAASFPTLRDQSVSGLFFLKHPGVVKLLQPVLHGGIVAEVITQT